MTWIESHQELGGHPKTRKLARLLGVSRVTAVGHLQFLWWWATDYAEDGNLARFDDLDIAVGAEWEGDPTEFVAALTGAGFLDPDRAIHDWRDYAGKLIERRKANAERMREARAKESDGRAAHVQRTQRARVERPNRTVPNQTQPDQGATPPLDPPQEPPPAPPAPPQQPQPTITPVPKPAKRAATFLPAGWEPPPELVAWAVDEQHLPRSVVEFETEKFVDHFTGEGKCKADWPATWRNWMRNVPRFQPRGSPAKANGRPAVEGNLSTAELFEIATGKRQL